MRFSIMFLARNFMFLGIALILLTSVFACRKEVGMKDREVTAKTRYSGTVNGSPISIDVLATIDTGRGGRSSCTLVNGPSGFNLATLGTMA